MVLGSLIVVPFSAWLVKASCRLVCDLQTVSGPTAKRFATEACLVCFLEPWVKSMLFHIDIGICGLQQDDIGLWRCDPH